jgi:hypothetical protein
MGFIFTTEPDASRRLAVARTGAADRDALDRRATLAVVILALSAILDSVSVLAGFLQIGLLTRIRDEGEFSDAEVFVNDSMIVLIGLAKLITFTLATVFFCRWMLQAFRNGLATRPEAISYTPREAVASFFIPFVNLVRPFRAVKQLFDVSTEPDRSDAIVRVWWAFYLAMGILGNLSARATWRAEEPPELIVATWLGIAVDVISVPAALLAAHLVRVVSAGLQRSASEVPLVGAGISSVV